jgi:transposase
MTTARHHLSKADAITVARIEASVPTLVTSRDLTERFAEMVRHGRAEQLPDWLTEAETGALSSFARGLRADTDAVTAGLREPWSNGQTEGQINRLKTLKRQMYGRANRGGSVRLNSFRAAVKWISALVTPPPGLASAG